MERTKCSGCKKNISEKYLDERAWSCEICGGSHHIICSAESDVGSGEYPDESAYSICKGCVEKKCTKCKIKKDESEFQKSNKGIKGLKWECRKCAYARTSAWDRKNKEYMKEYRLKWQERNKEEVRRKHRDSHRIRRKIDPVYRLNDNMSSSIWIAIKKEKAGRSWKTLVDYTLEEFMQYLERKFDEKMTWENYGRYWHIDHIKPKSLFNYKTAEDPEFRECWRLDNLQPLEAIANIRKSNKYII